MAGDLFREPPSLEFDPSLVEGFVVDPVRYWAETSPDKIALISRTVELSYSAIEKRTNQLAHTIRTHGIKPGDRVAFVMPRGHQAILTLIAILKTGAAYVP